ncbi:MAG: cellulase family glycosylhydrolase [Candidatus Glassbacteria bacterium]|nr:cellulase family glycosylhydrolase [Candidatus Glassbacteria bacterium]
MLRFQSHLLQLITVLTLALLSACAGPAREPVNASPGPLRVHPDNPRYFTDNSGKAIYLTGFHTWANLQEFSDDSTRPFDYDGYLELLESNNCNFIRLWTWENAAWASWAPATAKARIGPMFRYRRTGPGLAADSLPKFDVTSYNPVYFDRLRERVELAGQRGMYVMVMLFQGWSIERKGNHKGDSAYGNPWWGHPFNRANNVNGIDGDLNGNGEGEEIHQLADERITAIQQAYIRKVVDTLNDLDNILYEISNESNKNSTGWHYAMIDYIHEYEKTKPKQHPVVMTFHYQGGKNSELFASPAEAVSPNPGDDQEYRQGPSPADGSKIVLADTDHLWGIGGNRKWVWRCFTRGVQPMFMDPLEPLFAQQQREDNIPDWPEYVEIRRNMGFTRMFAERIDLTAAEPVPELASTGYCLAVLESGREELVVYLPDGGAVEVDLGGIPGTLEGEWFDPTCGVTADRFGIDGGGRVSLTAPFGGHAVLYLHR